MAKLLGAGAFAELPPRTVVPPPQAPPGHSAVAPGHGGTPPGHGGTPPGQVLGQAAAVQEVSGLTALVTLTLTGTGALAPPSGGGFATPAFVQGNVNASGLPGGQQVAFLADITAGHLLIASTNCVPQAGKSLTGVTDSRGNTWTIVGSIQSGWFGSVFGTWYAIAKDSGPCTVTFTTDGGGFQQYTAMTCHEISGIDTSNPLRAQAFGHIFPATTGADGVTIGPVTCGLNDYVWAYLGDDDTDNVSVGTGYTLREHQPMGSVRNGFTTEDRIAAAAGTITPTFSLTTGDHVDTGAATFRPKPL